MGTVSGHRHAGAPIASCHGLLRYGADVTRLGKMEAEAKDNQAFLDMLDEFERQKRPVSASPSTTYAPALFADHPDGNALSKERYRGAMERLLKASRIHTDTSGPPSKQRQHIKRGPP